MIELKEIGLTFQDEGHIHLLNGEEVPGCTTISGLFGSDGWKFAWPVKLMYDHLLNFVKDKILIEEDDLKKAKGLWRETRDKSADTGTKAHEIIEKYIKEKISGVEFPMFEITEDKEINNILDQFIEFEKKYSPKWLASELQVGSVTHRFAGILDALAEIDGKKVLIDFKTGKSIKDEASIQLAGLWICLEEMGFVPDGRAILHIPKKGKYEYRPIETDLNFEKEAFISAIPFLKMKNIFLARGKK